MPSPWFVRLVLPFLRARLTIDEAWFTVRMVSRVGRGIVRADRVARSEVHEVQCGSAIDRGYLKLRGVPGILPGVRGFWVDDAAGVSAALESQGWPVVLGMSWEHPPLRRRRR